MLTHDFKHQTRRHTDTSAIVRQWLDAIAQATVLAACLLCFYFIACMVS